MKNIPQAVIDEVASGRTIRYEVIEVYLSTPLFMTTAPHDIMVNTSSTAAATLFIANGGWLGWDNVKESSDFKSIQSNFKFNGAIPEISAAFRNERIVNKRIVAHKLYVSKESGRALIGEPIMIRGGYMQEYNRSVNETSGNSIINVKCSNLGSNIMNKNGVKTNTTSYQAKFGDSLFMDYASVSVPEIQWGLTAENNAD